MHHLIIKFKPVDSFLHFLKNHEGICYISYYGFITTSCLETILYVHFDLFIFFKKINCFICAEDENIKIYPKKMENVRLSTLILKL